MSPEDHIARIRKVRYHDYTRSIEITQELEDLLTIPKRPRMPNRLIVGPSNNGKTMLIRRFLRKHPRIENRNGDRSRVPIVLVEVDGPDEGQFYSSILKCLNSPCPENARTNDKKEQALHQLQHANVEMMIIDEFHNLLAGAASKQSHFRNVVKRFSNLLEIPIVAVGTELAYNAIRVDEQLANRFHVLDLPRWSDGEDYGRLLQAIKMSWQLIFDIDAMAPEIIGRTNRTIGAISDLLEWSSVWSLRSRGIALVDIDALKAYPYSNGAR